MISHDFFPQTKRGPDVCEEDHIREEGGDEKDQWQQPGKTPVKNISWSNLYHWYVRDVRVCK